MSQAPVQGQVTLVGAGPGDPELLTIKALRAIERADVIVHDRLVSPEILALARPGARMVDVGKAPGRHTAPQERINRILVDLALEGRAVVRLKGGDPFIFGRGSEEADALRQAGVPVEVIPGVTAAQGAAAATGVPLTHRGLATGVRYVTGHCMADQPLNLNWASLADPDTTLVVYMGAANIRLIAERLTAHGMPESLPAMAIANATTPREARLTSTLGRIADDVAGAELNGPILFVLGRVVSLHRERPEAMIAAAALEARTALSYG